MTKPSRYRMKMHEANRPPEYLQGYIAQEMDDYITCLEADNEVFRAHASLLADTLTAIRSFKISEGEMLDMIDEAMARNDQVFGSTKDKP